MSSVQTLERIKQHLVQLKFSSALEMRIPVKVAGHSGSNWSPDSPNARVLILALVVITLLPEWTNGLGASIRP